MIDNTRFPVLHINYHLKRRLSRPGLLCFAWLVFFSSLVTVNAHAEKLLWAVSAGGSGNEFIKHVIVGPNGDVIMTGDLWGNAVFGVGQQNETTLTSCDELSDMFIAKYDSNGTLMWVQGAGGGGFDVGNGLAVDTEGNVIVTGKIVQNAIFGEGQPGEVVLDNENTGQADIFVAKYSSNGKLLWALSEGDEWLDTGYDIVVDKEGNIVVAGMLNNSMYLAKYGPEGNRQWTEGSVGLADLATVEIDSSEEIMVAGLYDVQVTFGSGQPGEVTLVSTTDSIDYFLAKYTSEGRLIWAKNSNPSFYTTGIKVALDSGGDIIKAGEFAGSVTLGSGSDEITLKSAGGEDIFLAKYADLSTSVTSGQESPSKFYLEQNYPNPFNAMTRISFRIPKTSNVSLDILNSLGQNIKELLNERLSPGSHTVEWKDDNSSSGPYYFRLQVDDHCQVKKCMLIK